MNRLKPEYEWLEKALPEGIKVPSSTLISGPGGSGKPLVATMLLSSWLKQGGSIVYYLINSGKDYVTKMFSIYGIDISEYKDKIYFVDFDLNSEKPETVSANHIKSNLLMPENWETTFSEAQNELNTNSNQPIIFGAALNILLFSPTYREKLFSYFKELLSSGKLSLFTISNNVFEDKMKTLEASSDNLMFTHSGANMELFLKIERMRDVPFSKEEIKVPLSEHELRSMRSEAERLRKNLIPLLKKI